MYVCICNAVTGSDIYAAVDRGVRNMRQLQSATGCSTECGKCTEVARQELAGALVEKKKFLYIVPAPAAA